LLRERERERERAFVGSFVRSFVLLGGKFGGAAIYPRALPPRPPWLGDITSDPECVSTLAGLSAEADPLSGTGRNEVISVGLHSSGQCSQESLQLSATTKLRSHQSGLHGPDPLRPRDGPSCPQGSYWLFVFRFLVGVYLRKKEKRELATIDDRPQRRLDSLYRESALRFQKMEKTLKKMFQSLVVASRACTKLSLGTDRSPIYVFLRQFAVGPSPLSTARYIMIE